MEANAKKPKAKARPKLNPTENAALKRLEHDLINEDGIVPATKGRHAIPVSYTHLTLPTILLV